MKCVCGGRTRYYIGVYQCGLWSIVQVCLCGDWDCVLSWLWEGCVAGVRGGSLRCWGLCVGGCLVWWLGSIVAMGVWCD
jgi:hypothetical protein